jgi:hypothetical protein
VSAIDQYSLANSAAPSGNFVADRRGDVDPGWPADFAGGVALPHGNRDIEQGKVSADRGLVILVTAIVTIPSGAMIVFTNVDEQNVRDLELDLFLSLSGHLVTRPLKRQFNSIIPLCAALVQRRISFGFTLCPLTNLSGKRSSGAVKSTALELRYPTFDRQNLCAIGAANQYLARRDTGDDPRHRLRQRVAAEFAARALYVSVKF